LFTGISFAAQEDFPKKPITVIVNLAPGGSRDVSARGVANTMSKYLGVPMVIMNMPGAGGAQGIEKVYTSAPDGYTIGVGGKTDILQQVIEKQRFDYKKFTFIGKIQHSPTFFFVKADSPFRSVKDFKTFGKPVRLSTHSITSPPTLAAMILSEKEGFPLVIIGGYKGGAAALLGLVRGEVEFSGPTLVSSMPYVRAGQIRPLVTIDKKRCPEFKDTPTPGEVGYPELDVLSSDFWFIAPPGVPKERVKILDEALQKTLNEPEFLKWAKGADLDPSPLSSQETTKLVHGYVDFFQKYKSYVEKHIDK